MTGEGPSFTLFSSQLLLVGGKGGVGKTTTAAALAVAAAERGRSVVVVSVDPAHSLGDAFATPLGADPTPLPGIPTLSALEVDAEVERRRFLASHRGALLTLLERGTYLDNDDAAALVDLTIPGVDELAALFRLRALLDRYATVIVDTAPTGHTLRLLELPELARGWLAALQAMEDKSRAVSNALVGAYEPDAASSLLAELDRDLAALADLLRDPARTRFVLVTGREPVVLAETLRYQEELARRGIPIGLVVVNRAPHGGARSQPDGRMVFVPPLPVEPVGLAGLRPFASALLGPAGGPSADRAASRDEPGRPPQLVVGEGFTPPPDRSLYLVGGKGGVGKSTAAAALALHLQRSGRRVLLLSADPAGSLGDVLELPVGATDTEVPDREGLRVRQLEAVAEWEQFRSGYQAEAERVFAALLSTPAGAGSDRAVVERLVDLAPPGIDELAALMEVVDLTQDRPYDAVVLDTAPTGHLLRLLELPAVALSWTHQAMRLLLKYREIVAPGELAQRLLQLARSLRTFDERLRDPGYTWLLVVALAEALSVPETARLLERLRTLGIAPGALLVNRLLDERSAEAASAPGAGNAAALVHLGGGTRTVAAAAPAMSEPPRGIDAIARYFDGWRELHTNGSDHAPGHVI